MKPKRRIKKPRGEVLLIGLDDNGHVVVEERISVHEYYDSFHPILDEDANYRRQRGIRSVKGQIYNYEGNIDQEFVNTYGSRFEYVKSRIIFADGTVSEN